MKTATDTRQVTYHYEGDGSDMAVGFDVEVFYTATLTCERHGFSHGRYEELLEIEITDTQIDEIVIWFDGDHGCPVKPTDERYRQCYELCELKWQQRYDSDEEIREEIRRLCEEDAEAIDWDEPNFPWSP